MSRINCHSAFKHYEMFHSHCGGDVINIGSNNTTIFNMGTGFGGGSFWSGLGYGLGNAFGSIFGGMFGGGMSNMGGFGNFGGFGMSPFGMGGFGNFGFGMSPFGGFGNILGGGSSRVDSSSDGKGKVKDKNDDKHAECKDPDLKKINGFLGDLNKISELDDKGKADKDKVKAKYKEILDAKENQDKYDPAKLHKKENTDAYDKLLKRLQDIADKNGWGSLKPDAKDADKTQKPSNAGDANKAGNVKDTANTEKPGNAATVGNTDGTNANGKTAGADAGNFDDKLKAAGNDKDKLLALIKDPSLTDAERAKAKAKYAATFGYTNYDGKDTINKDNMKLVTDTGLGSKADITTYVSVKQEKGSHPTEITMQTKNSKTKVTYKYVGVVDGEYIYESQAGKGQRYALQKNGNGYALVQYVYHKGFDEFDVK